MERGGQKRSLLFLKKDLSTTIVVCEDSFFCGLGIAKRGSRLKAGNVELLNW